MGDKSKLKIGTYQNPNSGRSKESIDRYVRGMREKKYGGKRINTDRIRKFKTGMTPGQAKIAAKAPPPNKIDEKDFKVLREEKAKGRGMGLQDESVQPGKVMKANEGMSIKERVAPTRVKEKIKKAYELTKHDSYAKSGVSSKGRAKIFLSKIKKGEVPGFPSRDKVKGMYRDMEKVKPGKIYKAKKGMSFSDKMKAVEDGKINKKTGKPTSMAAMREMKGFKPGESASEFMKRRKELGAAGKALSATRIGKIVLPVAAAGVAAQQYLKSKMKKKDEPKKKMGGGMMQKPMGYKSGMGPAGAGGSMAGRPGGRRPMQQGPKGGIGSLSKKRNSDDLVVIFSTKDGTKQIKRSDLDNMSAPEKKMGGGMMKARRGRIVDDQKRDKRNPNRKPSTKIFDKIGDILKTPYYIRGGKKEKKMGGGMIAPSQRPGYSKGTMVKARGCKLGRTRPTKIT